MPRKTLLLAMATLLLPGTSALARPFRAGAARVDLTPPPGALPIHSPHEKDFTGVHDPVYARALALDDGKHRTLLIELDTEQVLERTTVAEVAKAAGVSPERVLLFASHTHSHPLVFYHGHDLSPTQAEELDRVRGAAVVVAKQAVARLVPARFSFGEAKAYANINNGVDSGRVGGDPDGPSDKTVAVLRVETLAGKPLAMMVDYAMHGSVMFRSVSKDGGYEVTGDVPGEVSRMLETGPDAPVVLYAAGAEGDQAALLASRPAARNLPAMDLGAGGWGLMTAQARLIADAVMDATAMMAPGRTEATIAAAAGAVTCPGQHFAPGAKTPDPGPQPDVSIPLGLVRIDDVVIAGVGGDVASPIGGQIKQAFAGERAVVVSMTAGAVGYILPDSSYAKVTHSVSSSPLKPGCAPAAILRGFAELNRLTR